MIIKNAIRHYRERAGLTQLQLSVAVKCSVDSVRRWESGQREPRASEIAKLCEVLGVSEAELLRGPQSKEWRIEVVFRREKDWEMNTVDMSLRDRKSVV